MELVVNPSPHYGPAPGPAPGPSDIPTSIKSNASSVGVGGARGGGAELPRVSVGDVTDTSATVRWAGPEHVPGVRLYQVQYNSSTDDVLIYR